jgi:CRISPR-associated protein Cmr1
LPPNRLDENSNRRNTKTKSAQATALNCNRKSGGTVMVDLSSDTEANSSDAPHYASLPERKKRARRGGPSIEVFSLDLQTTTPVLGGGAETRELGEAGDIIRVPSIRGSLRFWWRALYAQEFVRDGNAAALFVREAELWGRAGDEHGGRSQIEMQVDNVQPVRGQDRDKDNPTTGGYALFPVRGQNQTPKTPKVDPAERWRSGLKFKICVACSCDNALQVRNAIRAWILFGGYGSRTRRGVGSLTVSPGPIRTQWLPDSNNLRSSLTGLFGSDVFASRSAAGQTPLLGGATLLVGTSNTNAEIAWTTALGWLNDFRQKTGFARDTGTTGGGPGRSRWPEADKLRQLYGTYSPGHAPVPGFYGPDPAWPRAGFGLPIVGRFKRQDQENGDPPQFDLMWQQVFANNRLPELRDRVASPLIVKALPTHNGFLPCALWLNRDHPPGEVVVTNNKVVRRGSPAPFGRLIAAGDMARFGPLVGKASLHAAFLDWVKTQASVTQVSP